MNKLNKKGYGTMIAITTVVVFFSTLLLKVGISFGSEIGIGRTESTSIEKLVERPFANENLKNGNILNVESMEPIVKNALNLSQNTEEVITSKPPTKQEIDKQRSKQGQGQPINKKKQEELYQSVKYKLNIQKEDAKNIFRENINKIFGEAINITDKDIYLMDMNDGYQWELYIENNKDKKIYWYSLNAITSEFTRMDKIDYTELDCPEDGALITGTAPRPSSSKLIQYINKAKEIVLTNNILNSKNNSIQGIYIRDTIYIGIRPIIDLNVDMENGKTAVVTFYTDTDELVSINIEQY